MKTTQFIPFRTQHGHSSYFQLYALPSALIDLVFLGHYVSKTRKVVMSCMHLDRCWLQEFWTDVTLKSSLLQRVTSHSQSSIATLSSLQASSSSSVFSSLKCFSFKSDLKSLHFLWAVPQTQSLSSSSTTQNFQESNMNVKIIS